MAEVPKSQVQREVDCPPHKFYEWVKYSLHHLPLVFPEGYTDCKLLEGENEMEGCLREWKYVLPGSTEEHVVRARTVKQDDENMVIALLVEEGSTLHAHYRHFTAIVQITPKGEGSLVKWTVEFEKHHDEIPDPHAFLELFDTITQKVDAHVHKVDK